MIQALVLDAVAGTTYYRPRPISVQILPAVAESEDVVGAVEFASAARVILTARDVLSRGSLVKLPDDRVYEAVNGAGKPPFFHMWQWSIERRMGLSALNLLGSRRLLTAAETDFQTKQAQSYADGKRCGQENHLKQL